MGFKLAVIQYEVFEDNKLCENKFSIIKSEDVFTEVLTQIENLNVFKNIEIFEDSNSSKPLEITIIDNAKLEEVASFLLEEYNKLFSPQYRSELIKIIRMSYILNINSLIKLKKERYINNDNVVIQLL